MLSIQQLGLEILNHTPRKFYVLGGSEYGIKARYIDELTKYYKQKIECNTVAEIIASSKTKQIIPLGPALYVVRYDEEFGSNISADLAKQINNLNISGTVVCLYETKYFSKIEKYLPDNSAFIEPIKSNMIIKYLKSEFPDCSTHLLSIAAKICRNYGHARNICIGMSSCNSAIIDDMSDKEICTLFGYAEDSSNKEMQMAVASRKFANVNKCISEYTEAYDSAIYDFLSVAVELDRIFDKSRVESNLSAYAKLWTRQDIYNLFMQAYNQLSLIRSFSVEPQNCLLYLTGLLQFNNIPSVEGMEVW
jgi:hypothetical protein